MSLSSSYSATQNYKSVTTSCVFTDHFIQNILHFGITQILLFISEESFLCLASPKCNFVICTVQFLSALDSIILYANT